MGETTQGGGEGRGGGGSNIPVDLTAAFFEIQLSSKDLLQLQSYTFKRGFKN